MDERNTNSPISEKKDNNWLLPASILVAGVIIAVAVIYSTGAKNINIQGQNQNEDNNKNQNSISLIDEADVVLGDKNAPVTIIEFGDYQCPFCAKFTIETKPNIIKNYIDTGKAKLVFKDVAFLGPESQAAALAAKCAKDQGKFWEYHDAIFTIEYAELQQVLQGKMQSSEHNGNLNRDLFKNIASGLKMNTTDFLACYDSKKYQGEIDKNYKDATEVLGDSISTPSFLINGKIVKGALPYNSFASAIDDILSKK